MKFIEKSKAMMKQSEILPILVDIGQLLSKLWWRFFDWLALVPWKTLWIVGVLGLMATSMILGDGGPFVLFFVCALMIKMLAGGKRRAELTAHEATDRANAEQLERTVLEARMEALQAQIEPHFLFNSLASIDQLIQVDPPTASKMQRALIRYLRSALPQMREGGRPTLGQQVNLSSAFLEIMQIRMEERLRTEVLVPTGLNSAIFPSMMLQTLVENSIKHGLEPKAEGGRLQITAQIADGMLEVSVTDTGLGFAASSGNSGGGVGLANIRERLKVLYSGRAELVISVPVEGGSCATIRVPYEVAPKTVAAEDNLRKEPVL